MSTPALSAVSRTPDAVSPAVAAAEPCPTGAPGLHLVPGLAEPDSEQLALEYEWEVSPGVPAVPPVPRGLRVVADVEQHAPDITGLPEPRAWIAQLACAVAEVSIGARPPGQLTRWVARDELARLARRGTHAARHPSLQGRRPASSKRVVRSVRICPVAPGIIEGSAVLVGSERAQAIAIRIEAIGGRWLATVVDMR